MSMLRALSVLGGGLAGYSAGRQEFDNERRREDDHQFRQEERARARKQWADDDQFTGAMRAAAAPIDIQPGMPQETTGDFSRQDRGQPAEPPQMSGFNVAGAEYADRATAEREAERMRSQRVLDTVRARDPFKAEQLRTAQVQGRAAELTLSEAEQNKANAAFDRELFDRIPLGPDGAPDMEALRAAHMLSRTVPTVEKVRWLANEAKAKAEAAVAARKEQRDDRRIDIAERRADLMERGLMMRGSDSKTESAKIAEMEKALGRPLTPEEKLTKLGLAPKSAVERMSEADKLTLNDIHKQIETINGAVVKAQADNMWDEASPNAKGLRSKEAALRLRASTLVKKYEKGADTPADPLGVRGKGPGPNAAPPEAAPVARPVTPSAAPAAAASSSSPGPMAAMQKAATATKQLPPQEIVGQKVDAARGRVAAAREALQRFGLRQRAENPKAFKAAAAELESAQKAEAKAMIEYSATLPTMESMTRSVRYARP